MIFVCPDGEPQYQSVISHHGERLVAAGHEFRYFEPPPASEPEWDERLAGADGVLLLLDLPDEVMRRHTSLRVVSFCGTGVRAFVDVTAASEQDITVCNVVDYGANAVAEHAFALLLAVARSVPTGNGLIRRGEWSQWEGLELSGKTFGVVGAGPIGRRALEIGRALGMECLFWTRSPSPERERSLGASYAELSDLFSRSQAVSIHLAHTPETELLIGAELIDLLPDGAVLVNTSRGAIVDSDALATALKNGRMRGAGVDVFEQEPPPSDHPLLACENAVLTPHLGFCTPEANAEVISIGVDNLLAYATGAPQSVVS